MKCEQIAKALSFMLSATPRNYHHVSKVYVNEVSAGILREGCVEKFN